MLTLTVNKDLGLFSAKIYGDDFADNLEFLRSYSFTYDKNEKLWNKSLPFLEQFIESLNFNSIQYDISEYDLKAAREYNESLKEKVVSPIRRSINYNLMRMPPLEGKPPFENYQKQDILRAINQNRFLFNWEMGLGKSYALAAVIEHLRYYGLIDKCLIFSTGVGIFNLKDELLKFSKNQREEDILVLNSLTESKYDDRDLFNIEKYPQHTIIMTYDSFKGINNFYYDKANATAKNKKPSLTTNYKKSFIPFGTWIGSKPAALFMDECHSLGNPKSQRSKIFKMCLDKFEYRYEFTGTLADKYEKLYMPLFILDKALVSGYDYSSWLSAYNELGNRFSKYAINDDKWNLEAIDKLNKLLLKDYASKRLMSDCLELPLNYEVPPIQIDMSPKHRDIYESFVKEELKVIKDRSKESDSVKHNIINMFSFFQLACENIKCIETSDSFEKFSTELQDKIKKYNFLKDNTKIKVLDSILSDEDELENRGIVWYYHPLTCEYLEKHLKSYNPVVVKAGLSNKELQDKIKEFKADKKHKILLASILVMNTSVTITEATYNVYFEKTFNYTVYYQSKCRIFRPGQTKQCRTYHITFNNSIDNLQLNNLARKGAVVSSLLSSNDIGQLQWKKIFNSRYGDY